MKNKIEDGDAPRDFIDTKRNGKRIKASSNSGAYAEFNASTELFLSTKSLPIGFIAGINNNQKYGLDLFSFSPTSNQIIIGEVKNYLYYPTKNMGYLHDAEKSIKKCLDAALDSLFWKGKDWNSQTIYNVKQNFLNAKADFENYSTSYYNLIEPGIKSVAKNTLRSLTRSIKTFQESEKEEITFRDRLRMKQDFNGNGSLIMRDSIFLVLNDMDIQKINLTLDSYKEIESIVRGNIIKYFENNEDLANSLIDDIYIFFTPWNAEIYNRKFLEEFLDNEYWKGQWYKWNERNPYFSRHNFMIQSDKYKK
ncbi:hypothetical protein [Mesoplasma whartonense]|uniref:hypothetical protein n=1 Tax=Mesoplasma whartonense TaxID=2878854 RepID=UPI002022A8BE|nr:MULTISPECIES: hypothetical protein [unclassified Mesoplasma]